MGIKSRKRKRRRRRDTQGFQQQVRHNQNEKYGENGKMIRGGMNEQRVPANSALGNLGSTVSAGVVIEIEILW